MAGHLSAGSGEAGPSGKSGSIDATLSPRGRPGGYPPAVPTSTITPFVVYARARRHILVYGEHEGLFTMGIGLGGRREMSVESTDYGPSGRDLIDQALTMTPSGEPLFAAVAPGNARSLRWSLACGFVSLGSEVMISLAGHDQKIERLWNLGTREVICDPESEFPSWGNPQ